MAWLSKDRKKVIYISGQYSAKTIFGRIWNIYKAGKVALRYWEQNHAVICPHLNTSCFGELWFHTDKCDYNTWMEGDIEILRRCDAIVMMKGWEKSKGAYQEYTMARVWGKEIIYE